MGKHVAEWTLEHGWAEAEAYARAPRYYVPDPETDYLNWRLMRGRHVAVSPGGTAVGYHKSVDAWMKEKS